MQITYFIKIISAVLLFFTFISTGVAQTGLDRTVNALAVIPDPDPLIYAGTDKGLYLSRNNGGEWSSLGLSEHTINDISIDPSNHNLMYVVAADNGILSSKNGGKQWDVLFSNSADSSTTKHVGELRSLAIYSSNPSILYAGSFDGYILKSIDQGKTWANINPDFPLVALNALAIHPSDDKIIYAGLGGRGVLKSKDAGVTWIEINNGLQDKTVTRLAIDPLRPDTLYAGTYGGGVFTSEDGGETWNSVNSGLTNTFIYSMALVPNSMANSNSGGFFDKLRQKISVTENGSSAELVVGVYGGSLFRGSGTDGINWQPLAKK